MPSESLDIEVIARGVLLAGDYVLLCRSVPGGYRYLPGGHVEFGEAAHAALAREFAEESDLPVRVGRCVHVDEHVFRQKSRLRHEINVTFHVEQATPGAGAGAEVAGQNTAAPAPVASREPDIAFDWVSVRELDSADLRPTAAAEIIRRVHGFPHDPFARWSSAVE
ncbi:MAG: NUDIX domain-containing protein [Planctomycetota bacterium]|nr:NUDIX domain-containing protein [Planctomycetota bacterium]